MQSLQARLMIGAGIVVAMAILLSNIIAHAATRSSLYAEFDKSLLARTQALAMLIEDTEKGIEVEFSESDFEDFTRDYRPDYFQIWLPDGTTLAKSRSLQGRDLQISPTEGSQPAYSNVTWPNENIRRQIVMHWYPKLDVDDDDNAIDDDSIDDDSIDDDDHDINSHVQDATTLLEDPGDEQQSDVQLTIALARSTENIEKQLSGLRLLLMMVGTTVTLGCLTGLLFVIRQGLQPVQTIAGKLSTIDETSLNQQVQLCATPRELAPIVNRLNELLGRLETAFQRERDFSNNVAHELRTPLTGLKSTIEVYLSRPHKPTEYRSAFESCLDICNQSSEMVESLLALTHAERRRPSVAWHTVHLDHMLDECWTALAERAHAKGIVTNWRVTPTQFESDKEKLRVILRNVLTNAVSHCNPNGTLEVSTHSEMDSVQVNVTNTGNQLSDEQLPRVFDRFWRGDSSRKGTGEHFGLGLTLVKSLTEILGGDVLVAVNEDRFVIKVEFPRRTSPPPTVPCTQRPQSEATDYQMAVNPMAKTTR